MTHITQTIDQLNARLARGETTREALVAQALENATKESAKSVFTALYPEAALAVARRADALQAAGLEQPVLAGLPVSIKDLYGVAGETTMSGSVVCKGEPVQTHDAPVVARLRAAGSAIIGKTNMTEFAFQGSALTLTTGPQLIQQILRLRAYPAVHPLVRLCRWHLDWLWQVWVQTRVARSVCQPPCAESLVLKVLSFGCRSQGQWSLHVR